MEKKTKSGTHYYHQAVAATLVHPETREVIPLAVEPIVKQDGENKNDCERWRHSPSFTACSAAASQIEIDRR